MGNKGYVRRGKERQKRILQEAKKKPKVESKFEIK
jgi:hypothetical protein